MPIPVVNSITPKEGPVTGATAVAIVGTSFTGATGVTFGNAGAVLFVVASDTEIIAVSPPQVGEGFVHIYVQTPAGVSALTQFDQFEYINISGAIDPLPADPVQSTITNLRMLVGERIPRGGDETNTFFTDNELANIINNRAGNLYMAAADGWDIKAGEYASLIDISESGSDRKLSQMFRNAEKRAEVYRKAAIDYLANTINRVPGRSASILALGLGGPNDQFLDPVVDPQFDPWNSATARWWPVLFGSGW